MTYQFLCKLYPILAIIAIACVIVNAVVNVVMEFSTRKAYLKNIEQREKEMEKEYAEAKKRREEFKKEFDEAKERIRNKRL